MRNTYCWAWVNAELFVVHSLKKVMNRVSVSCQVSDSVSFCRAMLCIGRPMPSCSVCVSVRLVVDCVKTNKHIFKKISPSRS